MDVARSAWAVSASPVPMGKKRSGSWSRHAPSAIQGVRLRSMMRVAMDLASRDRIRSGTGPSRRARIMSRSAGDFEGDLRPARFPAVERLVGLDRRGHGFLLG